jgi:hypothetical protein
MNDVINSKKFLEMSIDKLNEIPTQDQDETIRYWMEEAKNRLSKINETAL